MPDPFAYHPELRDKIQDPEKSFFRTFEPKDFDARMLAMGAPQNWRASDEDREASRRLTLADLRDDDLWVFAYGSLMWDPAFRFAEVRKADIAGYVRRFCLLDLIGGRGTREAPGLMAALDEGPGCTGLIFRIAKAHLEEETCIIWRREMLAFAYKPRIVDVVTDTGSLKALTFVADHTAETICPDLPREDQVRYIATGTGMLGTSLQYIESLALHLVTLGIEDQEVFSLLEEARGFSGVQPV